MRLRESIKKPVRYRPAGERASSCQAESDPDEPVKAGPRVLQADLVAASARYNPARGAAAFPTLDNVHVLREKPSQAREGDRTGFGLVERSRQPGRAKASVRSGRGGRIGRGPRSSWWLSGDEWMDKEMASSSSEDEGPAPRSTSGADQPATETVVGVIPSSLLWHSAHVRQASSVAGRQSRTACYHRHPTWQRS